MSIINDLLKKRITFAQAAQQIETWGVQTVKGLLNDPTVVTTTGAIISDLKQAASDALSLGDTLAGPVIAGESAAIEAAADAVFKAYFGPYAPIASKATHDGVDRLAAGLASLIHSKALEFKASMTPAPGAVVQPAPANQ